MKSDRSIMNDLAKRSKLLYELSEKERADLKVVLLSMYQDLQSVCRENNLSLLLIGGSALGAVRHQGFIPWDDDLDVCMPRKDYDQLILLLEKGVLGSEYVFTYPAKGHDSKNNYLKIYRRHTTDSEIFEINMPFPKGVFLDVFPVENAPSPSLFTKLRGNIVDLVSIISVCVLFSQYPCAEYNAYMRGDAQAYKRYKSRLLIGRIARLLGDHARWVYWSDRMAQYRKDSDYCTIPTGTKRYNGELLPKAVFFPASEQLFEGMKVGAPHDVDAYLSNMYKNYMEVPPLEKRERHFVYKFSLFEEL